MEEASWEWEEKSETRRYSEECKGPGTQSPAGLKFVLKSVARPERVQLEGGAWSRIWFTSGVHLSPR